MTVLPGIDILCQMDYEPLNGKRVGLLTNPSAVTRELRRTVDLFRGRSNEKKPHPLPLSAREESKLPFTLAAIFTPEHGFAAAALEGELVESSVDAVTGAPIYSLYGESFAPSREMLDGLDVIVCDIQDIGVRYYTYAWTISHMLEAAGVAGVPVIILDRPNPLGDTVDGTLLNMAFSSLVGRVPIPVQHGMTLGELMVMFNVMWNSIPANLRVIACEGYQRGMSWQAADLHFVPTSPAMPHLSTAQHYPGACLIEGTSLSEGRGTSLPFEIAGAPFIDEEKLADYLNSLAIPGVWYRPHVFQPSISKFAGEVCHGVQVHIIGSDYRPLLAWMHIIAAIHKFHPDDFALKPGTFDRLYGDESGRALIEAYGSPNDLVAGWDAAAVAFREQRKPYLIYG